MEKATKSQAVNGIDHTTIMTPLRVKEAIQANGGGGGSYTPGDAIAIQNNQISVKYDNSTITLDSSGRLKANTGTQDYSDLSNKPKINNVTLDGNKTSADLGVQPTISDLATIRQGATEGLSALQPGDNISELVNNVGYITTESDPVFSSSPAHGITSANISSWTGKSTVTFTPSLTGGTKVGDLTIDGTTTSLYAPTSSQVPVYFLKNDGSAEDLAIINEVCAKHSSNEDFLLVGTFSDYESGKVFKAPMSVVRYNDERDEAMSFTTPLINLTDDSSSSYKEHYIQMALFFEGTWGAYTYSGSYRLSTLTPSDYLTQEEDPVFTQSAASGITSSDISNWDAKSEVSYNQIVTSGTKIAEINIDGTTTDIYAPQGGGGSYSAGSGIDITNDVISVEQDLSLTSLNTSSTINNNNLKVLTTGTDFNTIVKSGLYGIKFDPGAYNGPSGYGWGTLIVQNTEMTGTLYQIFIPDTGRNNTLLKRHYDTSSGWDLWNGFYAATASSAETAQAASYATSAGSASSATNATNATNDQNGTNISNGYLRSYAQSNYNCNTCYNAGLYMVAGGSNCPSGSQYGSLLVLPYRKTRDNTTPDFAVQLFMPNGDDSSGIKSALYVRTSIGNSWDSWKRLSSVSELPTTSTGTLSLTKSSGNSTATGTYARYGNVVALEIAITTTGSTASGGDLWTGTLNTFTPAIGGGLTGYLGARAIITGLTTSKVITVRNAGASAISSGSTIRVRGTIII